MGEARFDAMVAALAKAGRRRALIFALAAVTVTSHRGDQRVRASDVGTEACLRPGERCKRKRECCSEQCRSRAGKKRRKCRCSPEGKRCVEASDCCTTGVRLFCVSGFCVRNR